MEEMINSQSNADASKMEGIQSESAASRASDAEKSGEKTADAKDGIAKDPVGHAIMDFGRSLRNMAAFLLIVDIIFLLIIMYDNHSIEFNSDVYYDKFGGDFYTTVSKGLSIAAAWLEAGFNMQRIIANSSYYILGLVINITLLALTAGRGIYKIGMARIGEKITVEQNAFDATISSLFGKIEEKKAPASAVTAKLHDETVLKRPEAPAPKANAADKLESLEKLGELKEQGIITEEEFQKEKAKLL